MSNVVHHYLDGSQELAEFLQENWLNLSEFLVDMKQIRYSDNQFHIQFDTRGSDYPLDLVEEVLAQFPQTSWTAMEENCIRQAEFNFQHQELTYREREVVEAVGDCVMEYEIEDTFFRPQQYIFLHDSGRLIIEDFILNNRNEWELTADEIDEFYSQIKWMNEYKDKGGSCVGTTLSSQNCIFAYFFQFENSISFDSPGYLSDEIDEIASRNFTLFTSYLKLLLDKKQIRNLL